MENSIILGIQIKKKTDVSNSLQSILSKYGGVIKTRLGLNQVENNYATAEGIILLELDGDTMECQRLENELLSLENIEVKKMIFEA